MVDSPDGRDEASTREATNGLSNADLLMIGIGILSLVLTALAVGMTIG